MLLRTWTTAVRPDRVDAYLAYARTRSRAMFLGQPDCLGVFFTRGADGRHGAVSLWRDAASLAALAHAPSYRETAAGLAATGALVGEAVVAVHDLTGGAAAPDLAEHLDAINSGRAARD